MKERGSQRNRPSRFQHDSEPEECRRNGTKRVLVRHGNARGPQSLFRMGNVRWPGAGVTMASQIEPAILSLA